MDEHQARERAQEALAGVSDLSPAQAVLRLHEARTQLTGDDERTEALETALWDEAHSILVAHPELDFPETQWTQGAHELRQLYEAELAPAPDLRVVRDPHEEQRRREESMRQHPYRGHDAGR